MLSTQMKKIGNMQKQIGNIIRKMEILKKTQKEVLEMKSTKAERKNDFDDPISTLDKTKSVNLRTGQ